MFLMLLSLSAITDEIILKSTLTREMGRHSFTSLHGVPGFGINVIKLSRSEWISSSVYEIVTSSKKKKTLDSTKTA